MSNPTTPFGWQMPENTDLVTDLPADFEVFGQAVATDLQYLLGGTTGQILAKASGTDLDFDWVTDASGMTNPMTTTGDSIYSSSGSTPARLGIGSAGQVLTVASGIPSWATSSAGLTLINSGGTSLTGASVTIGSIPGTYIALKLIVENFLPANNNTTLSVRVNNDSTANRHKICTLISQENVGFDATAWDLTGGGSSSTSETIINCDIYGYANSTTWKIAQANHLQNYHGNSANMNIGIRQLAYNQTGAITSLVLFPGSGNFTSGTAYLYGVK